MRELPGSGVTRKPAKSLKPMTGWAIVSNGQGPRSLRAALGVHGSVVAQDELWGTHFISVYHKRGLAAKAMRMNADRWPDMELIRVEVRQV